MPWLFSRTIFSKVVMLFTLGQRKDWDVLKQPFGFDQKGIKYQSLDIPAPPTVSAVLRCIWHSLDCLC